MARRSRSVMRVRFPKVPKDAGPVLFLGGIVLLLFAPYLLQPDRLVWPNTVAFTWVNATHVFLADAFAHFLIRALFPVARLPALIGALTFMLMPYDIAHLAGGHLANVCGFPWMPAILLVARVSIQGRRLWPAALGGAALALQLMTRPQFPLGTLYLSLGMCGWQCWCALVRAGWRGSEFLDTVRWCIIYLNLEYVRSRLEEHMSGRVNHRLFIWSLLSFEWWCHCFLDGDVSTF